MQRLKEAAEKAKIELSSSSGTDVNLPYITADATGPKHIQKKLTRSKLEQLTDDLFERTIKPVRDCLGDAKWTKSDVNELVLVGGMAIGTISPRWDSKISARVSKKCPLSFPDRFL